MLTVTIEAHHQREVLVNGTIAGNSVGLGRFELDTRRSLVEAERHARPPLPATAPAIFQHILFQTEVQNLADERRACLDICTALGLLPSSELNDQIQANGDGVTLKWERHTEYFSYTFVASSEKLSGQFQPWSERDIGWESVQGKLLVSLLIGVEDQKTPIWTKSKMFEWDTSPPLSASTVMSGTTVIESDFRIDPTGNTRFLVKTTSKEPARIGRLVQRLIEIESYGTLCLYAWKEVKDIGPVLAEAETRLAQLTNRLAGADDTSDEVMLSDISELSAFHEATTTRTHFRLNASLAYHEIVTRRLEELREERIEGCQRLVNFIQRRMNPAAGTYRAILIRQEETAERISRATQLLRGRIEVAIGKQNQQLLQSMDKRAEAQYKLQRTVEGLSIVAITYYALGILAYIAAIFAGSVGGLSVKELVGFATPLVMFFVWLGIRRLRD